MTDRRKLAKATGAAFVVALVVLVIAVLPAEYGVDPTGIGRGLGFAKLSEDEPGGVTTTSGGDTTLFAYDVAWQVQEETLLQRDGYLKTSQVQERILVPFNGTNLTHLSATLRWDDDDEVDGERTEPDLFELSVEAPNGRRSQYISAQNDEDGNGEVEAFLQWRTTPAPTQNASGVFIDTREDRSAQGTWAILVRLYNAGGTPDGGVDAGNSWNLTVKARTYGVTNLGTFGSGSLGDRVALTLQPGSAVEYKFRMETGANMTYRWTSTAPVTFDFHGDEPGKEDEPTTHEQGVADRDQGNFTAPFSGRHGWWWNNRGQEPVTVTLETRGDYTILGVV